MSRKTISALYAAADAAAVRPILDALREKGFTTQDAAAPKKGEALLLFLSKHFAADETLQERFFAAEDAGAAVIPVDLDGAAQPELIRSALMARSAILSQGRTPEEIAARVASAPIFQGHGLPKWLAPVLIAAALLLAAGAGLWSWHGHAEKRAAETEREQALTAAAAPFGLRPEDLEEIESFAIIGDQVAFSNFGYVTNSDTNPGGGMLFRLEDYAYESWEDGRAHWYSSKDGHEFTLTRYDDLELIRYMPKLKYLTLILVDSDALPPLEGLDRLEQVNMTQCVIPDYEWLSGAQMFHVSVRFCAPADFSPLSGCEKLRDASFDFSGVESADLSGFSPPNLHYLEIVGDGSLRSISPDGLRGCDLREIHLERVPVSDLDFLAGKTLLSQVRLKDLEDLKELDALKDSTRMNSLTLENLPALRDISAIGNMKSIDNITIGDCGHVTDFSPIADCAALGSFTAWGCENMRDADFLRGKPNLHFMRFGGGCPLRDLRFLRTVKAPAQDPVRLSVSGDIGDYSGLAAITRYAWLEITPRGNGRYGNMEAVLPYLESATVINLTLWNCAAFDLSRLPKVTQRLELKNCELRDLSSLPESRLNELRLEGIQQLSSLAGIENIGAGGLKSGLTLEIANCPRLFDWSALKGLQISSLELDHLLSMPAPEDMDVNKLTLRNMSEVKDLHFLDSLPDGKRFSRLQLIGLEELQDLSPLRRLKIDYLAIPPQLQDQAEALKEAGIVGRYEPAFSEGGWDRYEVEITLESFEELETMPDALLRHVSGVCIAGDRVVDRDRYDIDDYWDNKGQHLILRDRESGEETELALGTMTDFSMLEKLTGLRELELYLQPIESLEGIQSFGALERLQINNCPKLKDASAAFTLQSLVSLGVGNCPIDSIRGVQNLHNLNSLGIWGTEVKDLMPLYELDTGAAERNGGFSLSVGGLSCEDYSPVASIGAFRWLDLNGADCEKWPDLTQLRVLRGLSAHGDGLDQALFEAVVAAHPELEELQIPYNEEITDLTPLLELRELRRVVINRDMKKAVDSLQGKQLGFELEIW